MIALRVQVEAAVGMTAMDCAKDIVALAIKLDCFVEMARGFSGAPMCAGPTDTPEMVVNLWRWRLDGRPGVAK